MLVGVEVGRQIVFPEADIAANQPIAGKQHLCGAAPGVQFEQAAVVPQIADCLAHHIGQKIDSDHLEDSGSPHLVATRGQIDIEGGASMLGLFRAVPLPQGLESRLGAFKNLRVTKDPVGKKCGEMFGRRSRRQMDPQVAISNFLHAPLGPPLDLVGKAHCVEVPIEERMDMPVSRLLTDEALYFALIA